MEALKPLPDFSELEALRRSLVRLEALRESAQERKSKTEALIATLEEDSGVLARVADLFRTLIDREVVDNATTAQDLLTEGLRAIFDDVELSVRAVVDIQRGKVSVELLTVQRQSDGLSTEGASTEAYGGSVATVQSVLLRIVVLSRRGLRPFLLLDESLAAVAEHYVPRVGKFLALLSDRLGLDILAVSHNPVLVEVAKHSYRIQKKDGEAELKRIR